MYADATTDPRAAPAVPARRAARRHTGLTVVRGELAMVRAERDQLRGVLADVLAALAQVRAQLADPMHIKVSECRRKAPVASWNSLQTVMPRSFPMPIIPQVATALHDVLNTIAASLERSTGFIQRAGKVNRALFVQTLVFTFLANPDATGDERVQTAAALGTELTEPGLTQRFTKPAATLLQDVLAAAITRLLVADPLDLALLDQFSAVYLEDSTIVALPDALVDVWRGCGNATDQGSAALKLMVCLDLRTGRIAGLSLHDGCTADQKAAAPLTEIGAGALYRADLGFFGLRRLRTLAEQQAFFLTRLHSQTSVFTHDGQRWDDVGALLATLGEQQAAVDLNVTLGVTERLPARLVGVRAPQEVVDQRRRRRRAEAARRGRSVSARQLALAAWTIFITNVPSEPLAIRAVLVLARCRWQIELVCKRWKSQGKLDESRSAKPWWVRCEVYAK